MAKKSTTTEKKTFPFNSPLVRQTEQSVVAGYQQIEQKEKGGGEQHPIQSAPQEQLKGVQAYIPMSMYRRLNNLKYERGETIGNLVTQAISFWLEKQEGA